MATDRRFTVGVINPTRGQDSLGELETLLPANIDLVRDSLDIREQTEEEFKSVLDETAGRVNALAAQKVDLIHPIGAPVFMVHGFDGERRIVDEWTARLGIPIFTSGQSHVNAMRALGIRRFVALSPLGERINEIAVDYFRDAGFDVLAFERAHQAESDRRLITWQEAAEQARQLVKAHPGAEGVYFISSGWRILDAIPVLEEELGIPVVHPVTARVWEIERRLGLSQKIQGHGRLLEELPAA